jgi:hypothetical protein
MHYQAIRYQLLTKMHFPNSYKEASVQLKIQLHVSHREENNIFQQRICISTYFNLNSKCSTGWHGITKSLYGHTGQTVVLIQKYASKYPFVILYSNSHINNIRQSNGSIYLINYINVVCFYHRSV